MEALNRPLLLEERDKLEIIEPFLNKIFELALKSEMTVEEIKLAFELGHKAVDKSPIVPGYIFVTKRGNRDDWNYSVHVR